MKIVGFVGLAGVVVFGLLYIVFFLKGASLKIPVIGMAVFGLALAAAVILTQMGITLPWDSTAGEPSESASASGELSGSTPAPVLASAPATVEELEQILIGSWSNARRENDTIYTYYFSFLDEGKISITDREYVNRSTFDAYAGPGVYDEDEYGWFVGPRGYPDIEANYSLTTLGDGRFTLVADGYDHEAGVPYQRSCELVYVDNNTILIDGATYVRGSDHTLAEYARIFGFGINVEDTVDDPVEEFERILIGSWSNAYRTDDRIIVYRFNFYADGHFDVGGDIYDNIHSHYNPEMENYPEDEYGWYEQHQNAGLLGDSGNYSLTALGNNRFALKTVLSSDVNGDWYTHELTYVNDNTIRIDGATCVRGSNYTLAEYARIFGFDLEVKAATDNSVEEFRRLLTGSWTNAHRGNDMIIVDYFEFPAEGEIHIWGGEYYNIRTEPMADVGEDEYGWYWPPMGHEGLYGNYSLAASGGNRFTLEAVVGLDIGLDWDDPKQHYTYELTYVDDNTIRIDGVTYVRDRGYTLAALARIFGFAIEP